MEFLIDEGDIELKIVRVDLPLSIICTYDSYEFFDVTLDQKRMTHPGYWVVDSSDRTPVRMTVNVKDFKTVDNAVEYARQEYLRFLRSELKRCRHGSEE